MTKRNQDGRTETKRTDRKQDKPKRLINHQDGPTRTNGDQKDLLHTTATIIVTLQKRTSLRDCVVLRVVMI